MEKFNVYINVATRNNSAKVDYGIIFSKNDVIWYRFAKRAIDKWKLGDTVGYLSAVNFAVDFARKNGYFIGIYINNSIVLPSTLRHKMNSTSKKAIKLNNELTAKYLEDMNGYEEICTITHIQGKNLYHVYNSKMAKNKFKRAV